MNSNFHQLEHEMNRFEAEISGQTLMRASYVSSFGIPTYEGIPQMLVPHQVKHKPSTQTNYQSYSQPIMAQPVVVSAKPTLYNKTAKPAAQYSSFQNNMDFVALQSEVKKKLKKLKSEKMTAQMAISQAKASSSLQTYNYEPSHSHTRKKGSSNTKLMRMAGGQTWEDQTLAGWPDNDFRIFCGDLGTDVTDELLTRTFNKYPSFQKAKVIRDRRTSKSKGYGFVSFKDPADFTKAMKEINGRYVGSRPIKLRKSTWRNRCIDVVKRKEKDKAALIAKLT